MFTFKRLELADRSAVESLVANSATQDCNYSFYNLYAWESSVPKYWARTDRNDLLIGTLQPTDRTITLLRPLGNTPLDELLPAMIDFAAQRNSRLKLLSLSEEDCQLIDSRFAGCFDTANDRDMADYLYRVSDLTELRGSHYQPKRNLINQFVALYPDWHYEPLTEQNRSLYFAFDRNWERERDLTGETITDEERAIRLGLCNMERLGLFGGLLYADDRVAGCAYGSQLTPTTVCKHFNKAETAFHGSYAMLDHCFASNLPVGTEFVNFEEDLGIEGLRRAKLSYRPVKILEKWSATQSATLL